MTTYDSASINLNLSIILRPAVKDDLRKMEWYGQLRHFRRQFQRAYRDQLQGTRLILVADLNDFPIGYILIQFKGQNQHMADGKARAYLYSFRVMDLFRRQGIGTHLIQEAETIIRKRGFQRVTIAVSKANHGALRLYKRLGYHRFAQDPGRWHYTDHSGLVHHVEEPCWLLHKRL